MQDKHSIQLRRIARVSIPIIFYSLFFVFLYLYIRSLDFSQLRGINVDWLYFTAASLFGLGFRYWGVFIWVLILKSLGANNLGSKIRLTYIYSKSWLGRYIPTPAAWMMGKVYFASQHGISKNKLAVSSLLEGALQVLVVMIVSFVMLVFDRRLDVIEPQFKILMLLVICGGILLMIPKIFNAFISKTYSIIKKKPFEQEHLANGSLVIKGALLYTVGALISGASLFFIAKSVYPGIGYDNLIFIMGVGNLAGAASMLAVFAPSGIGVREGIQLVLLSLIMPREFALIITVMTRVWGIGIDFLFYGINKIILMSVDARRK